MLICNGHLLQCSTASYLQLACQLVLLVCIHLKELHFTVVFHCQLEGNTSMPENGQWEGKGKAKEASGENSNDQFLGSYSWFEVPHKAAIGFHNNDFHSTSCRERVRGFKNPKTPPINLPFLALVPEGCTVHTKWRRSRSQWALTFRRQEDCPALLRLPSSAQERKYNSDNSIVLTCRGQV